LKDYISLQAPRQIFVDRLAAFRQPISHSHSDNINSRHIYPTVNLSLLLLIFTSFHLLNIIMSYDHSEFVTELNEFDCSKTQESRNVNIWICLLIPRSPWRILSRRVVHYPDSRPCFLLFGALRPILLVKCQRSKPRKPTRSSCAAKRPSIPPVDSGSRAAAAAWDRPPPELVWIEPHGTVTHGIDPGAEAAVAILIHRIGTAAVGP
jgi:hypothetical protein